MLSKSSHNRLVSINLLGLFFGTPLNTVKTEAPTLWTTVIAYLVPCAAFSAYILLFAC